MSRHTRPPYVLVALAVAAAAAVFLQATLAEKPAEEPKGPAARAFVTTQTLGGPDRYLTHLSTDKPIYRPGETVYMRGAILHHATHRPLPKDQQPQALVEIMGPKGDTVASGYVPCEASVLGYSWLVPEDQPGGEYTIKATHPWTGHAPAERKFDIRAYRAPRLKTQIEFLRDGYGPGDLVVATLEVTRAEGGVPAGADVAVIARVDGEEVYRGSARVNAEGICEARFELPQEIRRGEGTLAMVIEDGGVVETASKTIPILLQTVDLTMYPEGGELVVGLPCRVYFEAFTPAKKPADLAGIIVDADGNQAAEFRSEHEGRGRFEFTPKAGTSYTLKIHEPAGITTEYPLPEVKDEGVVLTSAKDVTAGDAPVQLGLQGTEEGTYTVTLCKRETELASKTIELTDGAESFELDPGDADGVLVATVWDAEGKPLAERLVFRRPKDSIQVQITADAERYVPGGRAKLTIETRDAAGEPVGAVVGVTVTDDSVLEMIEKREQAPRLPVMVLLEPEVKELADAHVYLDPENPDAPRAVDLLLGTQGWRRFALVDAAKFLAEQGDPARRALALRMESARRRGEVLERSAGGIAGDEQFDFFDGGPAEGGEAPMPEAAPPPLPGPPMGGPPVPDDPAAAAPPEPPVAAPEPGHEPPPAGRPAPPPAEAELPAAAGEALPSIQAPQDRERRELDDALREAQEQMDAKRLVASKPQPIRNDFVAVRIYAHEVRADRQPGERVDFTETLFWHAGIPTDPQTGRAELEFGLNDSVTSFRVFADAFSASGALGTGTTQIESVEPFYCEPKMPLEVTSGDKVLLPMAMVNATGAPLANTNVTIEANPALKTASSLIPFTLGPDERARRLLAIAVEPYNGQAELTLAAVAGEYRDRVTRSVKIVPRGFPIEDGFGGMLAAGGTATHEIVIPPEMVEGSMTTRAVVYPTPLANLTEALARLIREPCGCFEQTSSTTYPLVMAQQYFMSHTGVDPDMVQQASEKLTRGYDRLTGFECEEKGYEWFGADPGHETLTAYGLMEFVDMAEVRPVDAEMVERTRQWLLGTRDGSGGFTRERRALHTWIEDRDCSNAYITWALLETGEKPDSLEKEIEWVRDSAQKSENTYVTALAANVLALAGDEAGANQLLDKLAGKLADDGSLTGATTSIVGSGGDALVIETTSLGVLAWLKNPRYAAQVEKSMQYLAESCKAGRFGSTQSTVLALKAIVEYDKSRAKPKAPGSLHLVVDGQQAGQPVAFTQDDQGAIELSDLSQWLTPGKHTVQVVMDGGSDMPYSLSASYTTLRPATSEACKLHLETKLRDRRVEEGGVTEIQVAVVNTANEPVPMSVAIIGVPGGLEVRHDQLKELVGAEKIAAYEVIGREVVLYWRSLKAEQRVELPLSLVAAIPGRYTAPASRTYLYYTDEHKHWVEGLEVRIKPRLGL